MALCATAKTTTHYAHVLSRKEEKSGWEQSGLPKPREVSTYLPLLFCYSAYSIPMFMGNILPSMFPINILIVGHKKQMLNWILAFNWLNHNFQGYNISQLENVFKWNLPKACFLIKQITQEWNTIIKWQAEYVSITLKAIRSMCNLR